MHELISSVSATLSWDFLLACQFSAWTHSKSKYDIKPNFDYTSELALFYFDTILYPPPLYFPTASSVKWPLLQKCWLRQVYSRRSQRSSGLHAKQLPAASADVGHINAQVPGHDVTAASAALLGDSLVQLATPRNFPEDESIGATVESS